MRAIERASIVRAAMFSLFLLSSGAALVLAQPAKGSGPAKHLDALIATGKKFEGAGTCGGSNCHGGGSQQTPPTKIGSEASIWQAKDAHAKAATIITKPDLKANPWMAGIGAKLGVSGDLLASSACISCHGSPVPQNLQGEKFSQAEGVSCYQCHGPSEAWRVPHQTKGWADGERAKMDHAKLLQTHGLFDTRPPVQRAEMCASCHLAIDEKLVAAGHPQPVFEQLTFQSEEPEHWIDRNTGFGRLNLYSAGQVVAMRESLAQLATRAADAGAYDQAIVHVRLVSLLVDAKAIPGDAAKVKALLASVEKAKGNAAALQAASADAAALAPTLLDAIAKLPAEGDKASVKATLAALTGEQAATISQHGRRGIEQLYFALDRLTLAYREGAKIATADFKPVRDAMKPVRDLKLFETRNAGDAGKAADALAGVVKDLSAKVGALP